ncbi:Cathepsin B-like cysteine proteinase [Aphelenchoides besseyi]|nr:Cathepsin B-like cysteine proteinase [Aphelenchoides besseyi]
MLSKFTVVTLLCLTVVVHAQMFASSESDEETNDRLSLDKNNFNHDAYRKMRVSHSAEALEGQELVDYVNGRQNLWTATSNNKFAKYTEEEKKQLMGVLNVRNPIKARRNMAPTRYMDIQLPESFDAREQWGSMCRSVTEVRDQSSCGSCWSFGAVEAMSDRICIHSKISKIQVDLSAKDLLSCCKACGFGCNGGEPFEAWSFWHTSGIVTGSNYTKKEGCQPYTFPECEHHSTKAHFKPCPKELYPTPKCEKTCQEGYDKEYSADKYYGQEPYAVDEDQEAIKKELYLNGPLEVSFEVYDDFLTYSGGVYVHQGGKIDGGHAVKMVGWGTENQVPYWIIANSWNVDFGEDGYFRILRGSNECGIESGVVGGLPDLKRSPHHVHHHHSSARSYDIF